MYAIPQQGFPAGQNFQIVQQHQPYPGQPQPYGQVMQGGQFPAGFPPAGQAGGGFYQAAPVQVKSDDWLRGTEKAIRRDYDPLKKAWERRAVVLRVEKSPFASGSMRHAFKMEDLSLGETDGKGFVAKMSRTPATDRDIYFKDVEMQMEAKMWADRFNDKFGKKVVDFLVAYVAELVERPGAPLIGVEKMVAGNYVKYNNNWDWSDDRRNTPQAFSHFTWEESKHKVLVCDLQGVGDLWTDPQIHSADGRGYGKGNMGMKGIHAFLQNHRCNAICTALKLPVVGRTPKPDAQGTKLQPALYKPEATLAQCKAQYLLGGLLQSAALPGRKKKKEHRSGGNEADRIQVMVVGATGLSTAGGGAAAAGAPDSRVVLICGADQTNDTRVVYNSCEPQWNERIQMVLPTDGSVDRLIAMVFDTRQVNDDDEPTPLGFCFITFDALHDLEGYDDRVWPLARTEAEAKQGKGEAGYLQLKIHRFHHDLGASIPKPNRPAPPTPGASGNGAGNLAAVLSPRGADAPGGAAGVGNVKDRVQPAPYRVTPPKKDQVAPQRGGEEVDGGVRVVDHRDDYLGCKLKVTVKAAQGLSSATGEVNAFALVRVGKNEARTQTIKGNSAPGWGQKMLFPRMDRQQSIEVFVINEVKDGGVIGSARIGVDTLVFTDMRYSGWFQLMPSNVAGQSHDGSLEAGLILLEMLLIKDPSAPPPAPAPAVEETPVGSLAC